MPTESSPSPVPADADRIRAVYRDRDLAAKKRLYAWHNPDVRYSEAAKSRMCAAALCATIGKSLSTLRGLDVGCGTGGFLRTLVEWGGNSSRLIGTEFLEDRLEVAALMSPGDMRWHLGGLDFAADGDFDLVSAHTVFSSILDDSARQSLASEMWDKVRVGGWIMVFDFRYNNPHNANVRKVTRRELEGWWPGSGAVYLTGVLAPPLARRLVSRNNYLLAESLTTVFPFLRTHFVYMVRKNSGPTSGER